MTCLICVSVIFTAVLPCKSEAFRKLKSGDAVPNIELKNLNGEKTYVLGAKAKVNLVLFFRPTQEYSITALSILKEMCESFSNKPVHCSVIVSDYHSKKIATQAIKSAGWRLENTLVDKNDFYNDRLGVINYPALCVTDSTFSLVYEESSFNADCPARLESVIKFTLGEIDKHQLIRALNPNTEDVNRKQNKAEIHFRYAKRLLDAGKLDQALNRAFEATKIDNTYADAFALIGLVYSKQKKCDKAIPRLERALELDPTNEEAKRILKQCRR
jgi:tetratricopeptide (TPR) repeat protein